MKLFVTILSASLLLCSCAEEQKELSYKTAFDGLEGAERAGKPIGPKSGPATLNPDTFSDDQLIRKTVKGEETLVLAMPRHVIVHLRNLLTNDKDDLLYNQLVSDATKKRFLLEGQEPREVIEFLKSNKRDILELLGAMPMGELATDVVMERGDGDTYRLRIRSSRSRMLKYSNLWIVREGGRYKFLWVS